MESLTLVGSIDEGGFIKGLFRKGFHPRNGLLELLANCLDADATSVQFRVTDSFIHMIDNGIGMNKDGVRNMASMHRENHSARPKRGVSGIGCKPASCILSEKRPVLYYTHMQGGPYLVLTFPWDQIIRENRYTGKVTVRNMTESEIATFQTERTSDHGTTITFPYSDLLIEAIRDNFSPIDEAEVKNPEARMGIVFGGDTAIITLQEVASRTLPLYNYFGEDNSHYYGGKQEHRIQQYRRDSDGHQRFILTLTNGTLMEILKAGGGFAKEPVECVSNTLSHRLVGEFTVVVGLRKDPSIFNETTGLRYTTDKEEVGEGLGCEGRFRLSGEEKDMMGSYNIEHLGNKEPTSRAFRSDTKVRRNNQIIGTFEIPDVSASSARASPESQFKRAAVQCELRFNPVSNQDNPQDQAIGVQENKNQLNGKAIPLTLTRLIKFCKEQKAKAIWNSFPAFIRGEADPAPAPQPPAPAPAPQPPAPQSPAPQPPAPQPPVEEESDEETESEEEEDAVQTSFSGSDLISAFNRALIRHSISQNTVHLPPDAIDILNQLNEW